MPNYCTAGQSARVFFTYEGQPQDNVSVQKTPVEVTTETITDPNSGAPFTGGQCSCADYRVAFTVDIFYRNTNHLVDRRVEELQIWGPITKIGIENPSPARSDSVAVVVRGSDSQCNPGSYSVSGTSNELFEMRNLVITGIRKGNNSTDNCGDKQFDGECKFTVKDVDGVVRFQRTAPRCPVYSVICDGNCPPGTVECCGCCLPCGATKAELRSLVNQVRAI